MGHVEGERSRWLEVLGVEFDRRLIDNRVSEIYRSMRENGQQESNVRQILNWLPPDV